MFQTCLKDKQYKCCEENMFKRQTDKWHVEKTNSTNVVSCEKCWKTCLKDKQYKCCE